MSTAKHKTTLNNSRIGIYFLEEIFQQYKQIKTSSESQTKLEWKYINGVFNALGLGIEPTIQYIMSSDGSFADFENWIFENGSVSKKIIKHFNSVIDVEPGKASLSSEEEVLSKEDLAHWEREGYIVLKQAISKTDCENSVAFICDKIDADITKPDTWYNLHPLKKGIMVQLFSSPQLDKNRLSKRIRLAYQQLWKRQDLMVSMDRVSFNPPENESYQFPGPNLHWDVSLKQPIPFGLQGLLYLTDTDKEQGAFSLIPGFHRKLEPWLDSLDSEKNPRDQTVLSQFEIKPISGEAGDFIIWNHCLPHGSKPNRSVSPRIVQYINYQPIDLDYHTEWI